MLWLSLENFLDTTFKLEILGRIRHMFGSSVTFLCPLPAQSKLNLNAFLMIPQFNKSQNLNVGIAFIASPILAPLSDRNCGPWWLPKVTHLISGQSQDYNLLY